MAVTNEVVTVALVPIRLDYDRGSGLGLGLSAQPTDGTVYLGDANVTTANGFPVAVNTSLSIDLTGNDQLYAISAGAVHVRVLRFDKVDS